MGCSVLNTSDEGLKAECKDLDAGYFGIAFATTTGDK